MITTEELELRVQELEQRVTAQTELIEKITSILGDLTETSKNTGIALGLVGVELFCLNEETSRR